MNDRLAVSIVALLLLAVGVGMPTDAGAEPPSLVPIQAYLTDSEGVPIDAPTQMQVDVYTTEEGGEPVHSETLTVEPQAGSFTTYLGQNKDLDLGLFHEHDELWVELTFAGDTLEPRLRLATAPYAAAATRAADADRLGGRKPDEFYSSTNPVSWESIVDKPALQQPIDAECDEGERATGLRPDGTLICDATPTSVSAGTGLEASANTGEVSMSIAQGGVESRELAEASVKSVHVEDGTLQKGDISAGSVGSDELAEEAVDSAHIVAKSDSQTGAVESKHVADGTLKSEDLAEGSVQSNDVQNKTLNRRDIGVYGCDSDTGFVQFNCGSQFQRYSNSACSSRFDNCRNQDERHLKQSASDLPACDEVPPGGLCYAEGNCANASTTGCAINVRTSW